MSYGWNQDLHYVVRTEGGDDTRHDVDGEDLRLRKAEFRRDFDKEVPKQKQPKQYKKHIRERMDDRWAGMANHFKFNNPKHMDWSDQ